MVCAIDTRTLTRFFIGLTPFGVAVPLGVAIGTSGGRLAPAPTEENGRIGARNHTPIIAPLARVVTTTAGAGGARGVCGFSRPRQRQKGFTSQLHVKLLPPVTVGQGIDAHPVALYCGRWQCAAWHNAASGKLKSQPLRRVLSRGSLLRRLAILTSNSAGRILSSFRRSIVRLMTCCWRLGTLLTNSLIASMLRFSPGLF